MINSIVTAATGFFASVLAENHVRFLVVLACAFVTAKIIEFVLRTYVRQVTRKTKTDLDDAILDTVSKPVYFLVLLVGVYVSLNFLPETAEHRAALDGLFFVVGALLTALTLSQVTNIFISRWLKVRKQFEKTPMLVSKGITIVIYIAALIVILSNFNVEITPLVATLGIGGLAVGLALQNTLTNFFAGIHILSDKPVKVGDYVELEDGKISGTVEDIGWRSTRIRTLPNNIVIIPNSRLSESVITNDSMPDKEMGFIVSCGVGYGSDLRKVEKTVLGVAQEIQKKIPGAVKEFKPLFRYTGFGDSNINFIVVLRVEQFTDKFVVTHEFIKALKTRFDEEGIEISWPVRKVYDAGKAK